MRTEKSDYKKIYALGVAGLVVAMLCITFSLRVHAAEENSIPQSTSAKLYAEMSENSGIIANLIVGNKFEIVSEQLDDNGSRWYKVRTDFGIEGYAKASELDKVIIDAHELLYSASIASASAVQTPEDNPGEGDPAQEEEQGDTPAGDDTVMPDAVQPDEAQLNGQQTPDAVQADEQQKPDAVQQEEQQVPDMVQPGEEPMPEGDNAEENSVREELPVEDNLVETVPESGITVKEDTSTLASGAGFGEVDNTDIGISNDEFTVIDRTDKPNEHIHGKIDAVLIMIMAGGILCIIAIAALLKRMLTCMRTES